VLAVAAALSRDYLLRPEKVGIGFVPVGRYRAVIGSAGGVRFHAARALILTRLWANTPCPHQVRAPRMPVSSVRFQP
jgi:hypothetical protein